MQRAPFSHCVLGRTPAAGRRSPQNGGLRRCPNPRLGSLFAAQDNPRRERKPQKPRKRLISAPHFGVRVVQTRGSDRARSARRGDAAQHERLLMRRPWGTLHNANAFSCDGLGARCTTHTPSYATTCVAQREPRRSPQPHCANHKHKKPLYQTLTSCMPCITKGAMWHKKWMRPVSRIRDGTHPFFVPHRAGLFLATGRFHVRSDNALTSTRGGH